MRNKGAILTFTILLGLACLYQLSFTWVGSRVEASAKKYANGNVDKLQHYLDSVGSESVYPVLGFTYNEVKKKEISLGLDLKGGMNVVLQVSIQEVLKKIAANPNSEMFKKTLEKAEKVNETSGKDFVTDFVAAFENLYPNKKLVSLFYSLDNKGELSRDESNEDVAKFLRKQSDDAIQGCFQVLNTRVNLFGVAQPNIQRLKSTDRIMVELPGVKNQKKVETLLQGTAKLEFWETYDYKDIYKYVDNANTLLGKMLAGQQDTAKIDSAKADSTQKGSLSQAVDTTKKAKKDSTNIVSKILGGGNTNSKDTAKKDTANKSQAEKLTKENPLYAIMRPNVVQENGQMTAGDGPVVGYVAIKDTAKINKYLAMPKVKALFPVNLKFMWTAKPFDKKNQFLQLIAIKVTNSNGKAPLEGNVITDASQQFSQMTGKPEIEMKMNAEGANTWKRLTGDNIGKSIAIALDGKIYSFPTVQSEIGGGVSQITGNFTIDEAKTIANILKSGKLPAPAHIVREAVVGPSLGQHSINAGLISFLIALVMIWIYMALYYNSAGVIADIALIANLFFIFGILTSTNLALTLPGIAGVVLTIGMAVDANVLIHERVKEELRAGKTKRLAIEEGYKMSYPAIIDSKVTTLLTGIILWIFGMGPIQGFAEVLVIGILTSLFSAVFLTRMMIDYRIGKNKDVKFANNITRELFEHTKFKFIKSRKYAYIFSSTVIIIAIISIFTRGFSIGVDFSGGRTYLVSYEHPVSTDAVRAAVANQFIDKNGDKVAPLVKTFGSNNQVEITSNYMINNNSKDADHIVENKLKTALKQIGDFKILKTEKVGPSVARDIETSAYWAVFFSLIGIFIYIMVRFSGWQYGFGAIVSLIHDSFFVLLVYSLFWGIMPFSLNIDQDFIAAILTVLGYSIHDTVVVFDRIREFFNQKTRAEETSEDIIDEAINSTLGRTINSSITVIITLLMIFIFGGAVIRGFIFALLIGVIIGTYSSIFVASPIMYETSRKKLAAIQESKRKRR